MGRRERRRRHDRSTDAGRERKEQRRDPGGEREPLRPTSRTWAFGGAGLASVILGFVFLGQGSIVLAPILLVIGFLVLLPVALVT